MTQTTPRPATAVPPPVARPGSAAPAAGALAGPAGLVPAGAGQPVSQRSRLRGVARTLVDGSPGRLRLAGMGAVLCCLVFALLGAFAYQERVNALADANADVAQRIRVQEIATEVARADAILTGAFPSRSSETTAQLAEFDTALSTASQLVSEAAGANPADAAQLAQVSDGLAQYRQYAASARIYNRQGLPVSFGYLRQAGAAFRGNDVNNPNLITGSGALPPLTALIKISNERVADAYSRSGWATWEMLLADVVAIGGLIWIQVRLARRTRRYLNLPLAAATAGIVVVAVAGAVVMVASQARANDVRSSSYAALTNLANARIGANIAKSDASISFLYLRTGGDSSGYQGEFTTKSADVTNSLSAAGPAIGAEVERGFASWQATAKKVFSTPAGEWASQSTALADPTQPFNAQFAQLDQALGAGIRTQAGQVGQGLGTGTLPIAVLVWVALAVGLLGAIAAWAGIAQRLEDYR